MAHPGVISRLGGQPPSLSGAVSCFYFSHTPFVTYPLEEARTSREGRWMPVGPAQGSKQPGVSAQPHICACGKGVRLRAQRRPAVPLLLLYVTDASRRTGGQTHPAPRCLSPTAASIACTSSRAASTLSRRTFRTSCATWPSITA